MLHIVTENNCGNKTTFSSSLTLSDGIGRRSEQNTDRKQQPFQQNIKKTYKYFVQSQSYTK